jgi:MFS family permease
LIPAYVRGRVDIIIDGTWALGGVLASLASLVLYYTVDSQQQWRFQFLVGVLGIVPIFVMRRKIPESPRWLLFKHRQQEARAIVQFIKYNCENNQVMSLEQYQL